MSLFDEPSRQALPTLGLADATHAAVKGVVAMVPVIGSAGAEFLALVITPPASARRDAWLEDLQRRLQELEKRVANFRIEELGGNEPFVSAILQALPAAVKTHDPSKRDALRNAVLHVALGHEPKADRHTVFLALIDRFSALHLHVLQFLADPPAHFRRRGLPVPLLHSDSKTLAFQFVLDAMPELGDKCGRRWRIAMGPSASSLTSFLGT